MLSNLLVGASKKEFLDNLDKTKFIDYVIDKDKDKVGIIKEILKDDEYRQIVLDDLDGYNVHVKLDAISTYNLHEKLDVLLKIHANKDGVKLYIAGACTRAAMNGYYEIVDKILNANIEIDELYNYSKYTFNSLKFAYNRKHHKIVKRILDDGRVYKYLTPDDVKKYESYVK